MNPAVDLSAAVEVLEPHRKLRCADVQRDPGGGGINVARALKRLGSEATAVFPCGGPMGPVLTGLLAAEDVPCVPVPIGGETREDFSVREGATGGQFRFILPGPSLTPGEIDACLKAVTSRLQPGAFLVASGSLPPGAPTDFYARLADAAVKTSARLVLDTSGAPLRAAVDHGGLFLIKPSRDELAELAGYPSAGRGLCIEIARHIVSAGHAEFVCVSLGAEGAILVGRGGAWFASAPQVAAKSTIGAGDSMLAALVWSFANGATPAEALKLAVAAGSASLLAPGTKLCAPDDIARLMPQIQVEQIEEHAAPA